MRIISEPTLRQFWAKHPETKEPLKSWIVKTHRGSWDSPLQVCQTFGSAKALNGERVRFEVAGGNYRMIAAFDFARGIAYVKFLGTHAEYDKIDALTVAQF